MKNVWTWKGKYFGYIDGNSLWSYNGQHVGKIINDEIYSPKGNYLGEVMNNNRLITSRSKKTKRASSFTPHISRVGIVKCVNYVGNVMIAGYQDFSMEE